MLILTNQEKKEKGKENVSILAHFLLISRSVHVSVTKWSVNEAISPHLRSLRGAFHWYALVCFSYFEDMKFRV